MYLNFLIIYSTYLISYITSPTKLTSQCDTLIDNIMSNVTTEDAILGNIINTIFDHLGQFLILITPSCQSQNEKFTKKL